MDYVIEAGRRERKRQAIHQDLLDTALRLFSERGIARTTVNDIAEECDVARQTVFNHFPYKEAFALELGAASIREVADHANALLESGMAALEVLQRCGQQILNVSIEQGDRAAIVARELLHPDPERAARAGNRVPLQDLVEALLVQAREEGSVRADLPTNIVARRMSEALASVMAQVKNSDVVTLRHDLSVSFDIFLNGISERS